MKCAISDKAGLGDGVGDFDLMSNEDVGVEDNLQPVAAEVEQPIHIDRSAPALIQQAVVV